MSGQDIDGKEWHDTYLRWLVIHLPKPFGGHTGDSATYTREINNGRGDKVAAAIRQLSKDIHG